MAPSESKRPRHDVGDKPHNGFWETGKKRSKPRTGNKRKHADNGHSAETPAQTAEEKEQFDRITEAADFLMRIGEIDVYSQMKEEFVSEEELIAQRQAQRAQSSMSAAYSEESKSEENPPAKVEVMWEYKGADGQIHGPFSTSAFIAWQQQGYFVGDSAVDIRRLDTDGSTSDIEAKQPTVSAEEELMKDFEDSDEEETKEDATKDAAASSNDWQRSDKVDFAKYL
ncbi:hypothetical protein P43SY_001980 [Pythium insidiosum]|uniref:GYF domain-containing protein n=1 Tax=Pythium insidiosum TaxID=114742 RepID=A0AAD5QEH5_PYTIN|nr:hypothetical protein P43SY_001980 [Pythium insidiosum]